MAEIHYHPESFKDDLKKWRKSTGLSQTAFTQITGIPTSNISAYENGSRTPSLDSLLMLVKGFPGKLRIIIE